MRRALPGLRGLARFMGAALRQLLRTADLPVHLTGAQQLFMRDVYKRQVMGHPLCKPSIY